MILDPSSQGLIRIILIFIVILIQRNQYEKVNYIYNYRTYFLII